MTLATTLADVPAAESANLMLARYYGDAVKAEIVCSVLAKYVPPSRWEDAVSDIETELAKARDEVLSTISPV